MTPDEYKYFEEICQGYDRPNFQGKDLFQDHFESNDSGIIVFVKPPHKKYSSMEVFTFLISVQVNQQLRLAREQVEALVKEAENKLRETFDENAKLKEKLNSLNEEVEHLMGKSIKVNPKKERETNDGTDKDNRRED
jgi:septal ring factor EnvC (AmiA/AmiB activator)